MEESLYRNPGDRLMRAPTLRDVFAVVFRHKGLIASSFTAIFLGVVIGTYLMPNQYEGQMKILVKRERADPVVTPQSSAQAWFSQEVSQEDLNSEVELLKSRDLLEKVVVTCGLHERYVLTPIDRLSGWLRPAGQRGPDMRIPRAVQLFEKRLSVEPITKSKLIEVRYEAPDPRLAAQVLETLATLYLDKHLAVHRPPGAVDFFQQQTDRYHEGLVGAERQLSDFARSENVVSIELEKEITLRKLSDFESQMRESHAAEAALQERIRSLERQLTATPARVTTQVRTADNPYLLQQMKTTLLSLELKRTELLSKYDSGYRLVQELDQQIAQARRALSEAERNSLRDETTDLDRTHALLQEELARARAELATAQGRSDEIENSVALYRDAARRISRKEIVHQDLLRSAKTAEENYLLYLRKQEEARISDALDRKRIVNVAMAEAATVPALPSSPRWGLNLILGFLLACLTSLGLAFVADYLDATFRTPDEVENLLGVPVLAATPEA